MNNDKDIRLKDEPIEDSQNEVTTQEEDFKNRVAEEADAQDKIDKSPERQEIEAEKERKYAFLEGLNQVSVEQPQQPQDEEESFNIQDITFAPVQDSAPELQNIFQQGQFENPTLLSDYQQEQQRIQEEQYRTSQIGQ